MSALRESLRDLRPRDLADLILDRWMPLELHGYERMGPEGREARDALEELVRRAERGPE